MKKNNALYIILAFVGLSYFIGNYLVKNNESSNPDEIYEKAAQNLENDFPELSQSSPKPSTFKSNLETKSQNDNSLVGLWETSALLGYSDVLLKIRKEARLGYILEFVSTKNINEADNYSILEKRIINGNTIFVDLESTNGDYWLIEKNGDLSAYDMSGYVLTLKLIRS